MNNNDSHECACEQCKRILGHGDDALTVRQGVVGARGFVEVSEPILFCSVECLIEYYEGAPPEVILRRRIP